jgi:hypothetical protein
VAGSVYGWAGGVVSDRLEDTTEIRQTVARRELQVTLTATEGEWPHDVRDVARTLSALDRLLRTTAKHIDPAAKVKVVLTRVDILDDDVRLTVRVDPVAPRVRRRAPR